MRKLLLILALFFPSPIFAAIAATAQWDVRTTGSDSNGGAFDPSVVSPGTDFSQQNSAQIAFTDLVIGGTTTQLTSAAHPFGSTYPGNFINITGGSGCTAGRYEISSVSSVTATMDRSVGTAASTCTGNLGGSLLTIGAAVAASNVAEGNTVYIQSGTYAAALTLNWTVSTNALVNFVGYQVTHGDSGTAPLITTTANSLLVNTNARNSTWRNISFSNTGATRNDGFNGLQTESLYLFSCTLDGFRNGVFGDNGSRGFFSILGIYGTEIKNSTAGGVENWAGTVIQDSYIHNNATFGVASSRGGQPFTFIRSIVSANGADGMTSSVGTATITALSSNFSGNTGAGLSIGGGTITMMENNIFYGNSTYGVSITTAPPTSLYNRNNAYGANTTAARLNISAGTGDVTLSATPFTNSGSGDFSLNSTAGGGAAAKGAGFPGAFQGGTSTGHLDIGAVQSAGGGGVAASNFGVSN